MPLSFVILKDVYKRQLIRVLQSQWKSHRSKRNLTVTRQAKQQKEAERKEPEVKNCLLYTSSEKAEAGQAIINACKSMNSPDAIPLGEYRGFQMELYFDTVQRNYVVKLKGETSRDVPLGDDAHGNIVRIDNGIERFEETLADTKNSLENTEKQFETAKQEIEKPFAKEEELRAKTARLDELNILLNMDKKENEIVSGEPDEGEAVGGRKEKSYER